MSLTSQTTSQNSKPFRLVALVLFFIGFVARVAPLFDQDGRLLRQFPTEDGYLMLTIARNLALGKGMSTADGYLPTNGTQPLFNFFEAAVFYLVDGDKRQGVAGTLACHVILSALSAYGLMLLVRQVLRSRPALADRATWLAAGLWFASPIVLPHTMNCLETGLYGTTAIYSLWFWQRLWVKRQSSKPMWLASVGVGVAFGVTFWARIDAIFLIAAITSMHLLIGWLRDKPSGFTRLTESVIMGATSVVVGSPWLISNYQRFGSIMPISGVAQSASATFASNITYVPSQLVEYALLLLPIPHALETTPLMLAFTSLLFVAYLFGLYRMLRHMTPDEQMNLMTLGILAGMFAGYYGLLFGAPHFVGRYLFLLSIPGALIAGTALVLFYDHLMPRWRTANIAALGVAFAATIGFHWRLYANGKDHMHFQVVDFVEKNIDVNTWVGAIQTGTVGFFHDRTVNLDGKVNPVALKKLLANEIPQYVVTERFGAERQRIEWLVDWTGIAGWHALEPIASNFDLVVDDPERNLAALRRRP